jgi:hypothetical protein
LVNPAQGLRTVDFLLLLLLLLVPSRTKRRQRRPRPARPLWRPRWHSRPMTEKDKLFISRYNASAAKRENGQPVWVLTKEVVDTSNLHKRGQGLPAGRQGFYLARVWAGAFHSFSQILPSCNTRTFRCSESALS